VTLKRQEVQSWKADFLVKFHGAFKALAAFSTLPENASALIGPARMAVVGLPHTALFLLIGGVTSQIPTPRKRTGPLPLGLGPDRVCSSVAWVSPLVCPTRKPQLRNSMTTLPDTAIARLKASSQFLAHEELGDDHTLVD
jgi:hypothetical protein